MIFTGYHVLLIVLLQYYSVLYKLNGIYPLDPLSIKWSTSWTAITLSISLDKKAKLSTGPVVLLGEYKAKCLVLKLIWPSLDI